MKITVWALSVSLSTIAFPALAAKPPNATIPVKDLQERLNRSSGVPFEIHVDSRMKLLSKVTEAQANCIVKQTAQLSKVMRETEMEGLIPKVTVYMSDGKDRRGISYSNLTFDFDDDPVPIHERDPDRCHDLSESDIQQLKLRFSRRKTLLNSSGHVDDDPVLLLQQLTQSTH